MKQKTPDLPSDEKKESEKTEKSDRKFSLPNLAQQAEEISDDYEWFEDQRGGSKGFREVVRGIPIVPQKGKKAALTKEATKSFTILGDLYHQKQHW